MSPKNNTKVLIGGNVYTLSGYESEEYIQRVALYINNKMDEIKHSDNGQLLNSRLLNVLLCVNIADELFKERDKKDSFDDQLDEKDKEILRIKEELLESDNERNELLSQISTLESDIIKYKKELDEYIEVFEEGN